MVKAFVPVRRICKQRVALSRPWGVVLSDSRVVGRWVTVGLSVNSGVGEVHPEE